MHCTAVRTKASLHYIALPYLNTLQLVPAIFLQKSPPPPPPLHCNVLLSNLYCCSVNCSVYTDVHCCTPRSIEDSVVQCSAAPILYCDMYSVHRTLLFARGLLRTPPLPPLSLSMTTSTTNLVASNHRAGKCDFQAHFAVERHEWSEIRVDWSRPPLPPLSAIVRTSPTPPPPLSAIVSISPNPLCQPCQHLINPFLLLTHNVC